jgi:4-amino-4-deoxy-L-arabinose transferase-like glycosyltransferase
MAVVRKHSAFLGLLILAVAFHFPIFGDALNPDSTTYLAVASALASRGSLQIETTLVPQHPPLMAFLLTPFGLVFGFNEFSVHLLELVAFVILLCLTYAMSRTFGSSFALVPSVLLSLDPVLYLNMSDGRSVSVLMTFALATLYAIWRGLNDSRWLVVAAVISSLSYMTADSVGYLFPIAGVVGLAWRFHYVRWRVFRDAWYLSAIAIFSGTVLVWTGHNVASNGTPYTDPRVVGYLNRLLGSTALDIQILLIGGFLVYFTAYLAQNLLPFLALGEARSTLKSLLSHVIRDQRIGAMALFAVLAVIVSALLSSAFVLYEPLRSLAYADTYLRYAAVVAPITCLGVGMLARRCGRTGNKWLVALAVAIIILGIQFVPQTIQRDQSRAWFDALQTDLLRRNITSAYSDIAVYLRYNGVRVAFMSVDKGYSSPTVNISAIDVPPGSALLTFIYAPFRFDERIEGLYLIRHFDPAMNSPFVNLYYRG